MKTTKKRRRKPKSYRLAPLVLPRPRVATEFLPEPDLVFADGGTHCDPKTGVPFYGPRSLGTERHKNEVHVGFIGPAEAADGARKFLESCALGVSGDANHAPFPGCSRDQGYRCELRTDPKIVELLSRQEERDILRTRRSRERFERLLDLLEAKLKILTQRDHPLDYVVLALPDSVFKRCGSVDYIDKALGPVHRDLRRAFKARAMRYQKPTQILLESTTGLGRSRRKLDHPSVIAWNLLTGLYSKVDGLPWGPTSLPPASCFIGIGFFRPLGSTSMLRTSVVQAFDENGDGLVLRGHRFHWDEQKDGRSPHLSEESAAELVSMVLDRYREERNQSPRRVVVHKTSRFEEAERAGFEEALRDTGRYDLISLTATSHTRLIRAGRYPPLRGTSFSVGDVSFLYTTGYIPSLGRYPHGHVPSPLQVSDHVGDTPRTDLLREIMVLTKMNWNSANPDGLTPITLRFSRLVGDVLREVPEYETPQPKYKFYM